MKIMFYGTHWVGFSGGTLLNSLLARKKGSKLKEPVTNAKLRVASSERELNLTNSFSLSNSTKVTRKIKRVKCNKK